MPRASSTGIRGLFRDGAGRFHLDLRWHDAVTGEARRHRERLPAGVNAKAAKARALSILNAAQSGTYVAPVEAAAKARASTEGRLGAALGRYHAHNATRGLRSADGRKTHGELLVEVLGADRPLASLVALDVERVRKHLRDAGREPATCNRHLATLKHFARWAEDVDGTMPPEVAARLRKVRPMREPPGRVRYVHADEEATLATLTGWLRPIVDAARVSGCRLGELTSLRPHQVDRAARAIDLGRTKSGRRRVIPITAAVAAVLDSLPTGGAYVFPIRIPETPRSDARSDEDKRRRDTASTAFGDWKRAAGLTDLRLHDMRHDFATRVRRSGEGLDVVAALLGHASLQMSARYAHLDDAATRRAAAKVTLPTVPTKRRQRVAHALPTARLVEVGAAARKAAESLMGHPGFEPGANGLRDAQRRPKERRPK